MKHWYHRLKSLRLQARHDASLGRRSCRREDWRSDGVDDFDAMGVANVIAGAVPLRRKDRQGRDGVGARVVVAAPPQRLQRR